jgi:hypothetical protein
MYIYICVCIYIIRIHTHTHTWPANAAQCNARRNPNVSNSISAPASSSLCVYICVSMYACSHMYDRKTNAVFFCFTLMHWQRGALVVCVFMQNMYVQHTLRMHVWLQIIACMLAWRYTCKHVAGVCFLIWMCMLERILVSHIFMCVCVCVRTHTCMLERIRVLYIYIYIYICTIDVCIHIYYM